MDAKFLLVWTVFSCLHVYGASVDGLQTASVEVVIYENTGSDYTTYTYELKGKFSKAGAATSAEGDILQIHPLGLCNTSDDRDLYEYGWVGVVKLTAPDGQNRPCFTLFEKAKRAMQRGATAIIFDTTDVPDAVEELNSIEDQAVRPVVLIKGPDAKKLMNILKNQKVARARIQYGVAGYTPQRAANEYLDMVIFMTFFILVSVICFILLLKIKWRQKQKESSLTRMALHALSRMETRQYESSLANSERSSHIEEDGLSETASLASHVTEKNPKCVICLEGFKNGQDLRIVPCRHEFHKECVDPWLLSNFTCPLCMLNIVERDNSKKKPGRPRRWFSSLACGRCLRVREAEHSPLNLNTFHHDFQIVSIQESEQEDSNKYGNTTNNDAPLRSGRESNSVANLSDISSVDFNRDIEGRISEANSSDGTCAFGYMPVLPPLRRDYTHQMVVVAPLKAGMLDASQEDIV
ncbi:E3 ubiquitin-protein ligase ZNRF3 [Nematostella vectensis]|nr:E3 ubiquitin-protein ligase ZNRF3 [Nematostella vectensis]